MTSWPPMERTGPAVTEEDVRAFEERLGVSLPEDYRLFLLQINGGRTASKATTFSFGARGRTNLNSILSLNDPKGVRNIEERNELIADDLPPELLLIASDDGGSRVCLCIRGEHKGEVWFFDTKDRRPEGSNARVLWHDRRDMTKLADSFKAFAASLGPLDAP